MNEIFCGLITYELIFEFFFENHYSKMENMKSVQIKDLDISKKSIIKLCREDSIYTCFFAFERNRISMIPIMNVGCTGINSKEEDCFGYLFLRDFIYFWNFYKDVDVSASVNLQFELKLINLISLKILYQIYSD